jgi:multicomponent Na+:H+ antiporter subunit B
MNQNPVFRVVAKILFAPIIMFGLYVQFHGDFGPGGGFQAGVIIAAAFILHALVFGLQAGRQIISARVNLWMMVLGVTIYGAVGIVSMAKGGLFLDYTALTGSVGSGQHIGILVVEFGVGLTVTSVMLALFHDDRAFHGDCPGESGEKNDRVVNFSDLGFYLLHFAWQDGRRYRANS